MESITIRLARRLLAAAPAVHRTRHARHRLTPSALAMARNPEAVVAMNEAGWEIASHGYKWDRLSRHAGARSRPSTSPRRFASTRKSPAKRPLGFYQAARRSTPFRSAARRAASSICADAYADDLPYWIEGPKGPQLIVPYTLDSNDMRFARRRASIPATSSIPISRTPSTCSTPKRDGAEDAVDRPALPPGRPAGARRLAGAVRPITRFSATRCGSRPGSTSPPLDRPSSRRRAAGSRRG